MVRAALAAAARAAIPRVTLALAACSGARAKVEDSRPATLAPSKPADAAPVAPVAPASGAGDVAIRVEWHDVPAVQRASPGRSACGTGLPAQVAPTVTWGIPDAFVMLSAERAKPGELAAKIVLDRCAFAPRAVVAGATLAVTSTALQPAELAVTRRLDPRTTAPSGGKLQLPIAGHEVDVPLDPGGWYELAAGETSAWVLSSPKGYAGVTDATGVYVARDVPVGTYTVNAWLPAYARGAAPRSGQAQVTVTAGALAEVTVDIGK